MGSPCKGIMKITFQGCFHPVGCKERHDTFLQVVEWPHIVHPCQMVFVFVGVHYGIQTLDSLTQHLGPEIRTCVHHDTA